MDGILRVVQSSGKKIDWGKFKDMYFFREFLERQSKKMLDKTDEKLKENLENLNQDAASKMLTKEKELAEVADKKLKQLTEEPAKDSTSIKNFSKVLVFILGFILL